VALSGHWGSQSLGRDLSFVKAFHRESAVRPDFF
jgi:hypothetical protein